MHKILILKTSYIFTKSASSQKVSDLTPNYLGHGSFPNSTTEGIYTKTLKFAARWLHWIADNLLN